MFYPTSIGGPSNTLYWHTCYLNRNNFTNYVVTTDYKLDFKKHNIKLDTWIKNEIGNIIYCKTNFHFLPLKAFIQTLIKIPKVDVVHYSSAYYYLTIYTFIFCLLFKKKIIISPRGEFFRNAIDSKIKKIVIKLYGIFQKKITFHATSEQEKLAINDIYPNAKVVVQPNFVNINTSLKKSVSNKNIVFLGIIYSVKKIENIIDAIVLSKMFKLYGSKFIIAGKPLVKRDYAYKKMLEDKINTLKLNHNVIFIGEVFGAQKEKFLNDAYILILPSESENFGNVIVESLAQSTPVIASKGTPWKILNETNSGWWVENDPFTLSQAIDEALVLDDVDYLKMSNNSLNLLNSKYSIDTSPDNQWIYIYNKL